MVPAFSMFGLALVGLADLVDFGKRHTLTTHPSSEGSHTKECWYFVKEGQKFTRKDITGERMSMKGAKDLDPEMRQAFTDSETGLMRAGALPKVAAASAAGSKSLLDAIEKVWLGGSNRMIRI